jgi:voltage-gated potassium channel
VAISSLPNPFATVCQEVQSVTILPLALPAFGSVRQSTRLGLRPVDTHHKQSGSGEGSDEQNDCDPGEDAFGFDAATDVVHHIFNAIGFAGDAATGSLRSTLEAVDVGLTAVFIAEFATRFTASFNRAAYLRGHWLDLFALIPVARGVRVLRLLRLLRLVRAFAGIYRALEHFERMARHRGLAWLFIAWLGIMVICSAFLYTAEVGINEAVASPFDALWWGITTLTTVGYGDVVPKTAEGKIAASVLMVLGISLFSAITATVTSFMLVTADAEPAGRRLRELADLHAAGLLTDEEYAAKRTNAVDRV